MDCIVTSEEFERLNSEDIVREVKDYCLSHGITLRSINDADDDVVHVLPVTAFPSPFPKKSFDYAKSIQQPMNLLMHHVAHDHHFLNQNLEGSAKVDDFTRRLLDLNNKMEKIGRSQPFSLGHFRTDYMINDPNGDRILQVETNSIASGFAALGPKVTQLHKNVVARYLPHIDINRIPENPANINYAHSFLRAFELYGNPKAVILFVVEDRVRNLCDQRHLEFEILNQHPTVHIVRRSFTALHEVTKLTEDRRLLIDGEREVAVVYYRHCYDPSHYTSDESWDLRLKIEMSKAFKSPSINYHLAGLKKIQQVLTDRDILEKFLSRGAISQLLPTFASCFGLERNESGDKAIQEVLSHPEDYVLKPQREGGGHNIYGADIPPFLSQMSDSNDREGYIAMEMIRPPVLQNVVVDYTPGKQCTPQLIPMTGELGVFGSILGSKTEIIFNQECGHVMRSKKLGVNEGGVNAGFGGLDSPLFF